MLATDWRILETFNNSEERAHEVKSPNILYVDRVFLN